MKKKIMYVEPMDYFPKELREKYKLGEYSEINVEEEPKKMNETKDDNKKEKIMKKNNRRKKC